MTAGAVVFILVYVWVFIWNCFRYLADRLHILATLRHQGEESGHFTARDNFDDWQNWLSFRTTKDNHHQFRQCEGLVVSIPSSVETEKNACRRLLGPVCGMHAQRVRIPRGLDVYTSRGGKLEEGHDYCFWKAPSSTPPCHPKWGYLQYSRDLDRWQCRSHVSGIYNAKSNKFEACEPGGQLLYEGKPITDYSTLEPETLYRHPDKFRCSCQRGYVSEPSLSRSTCFPDPCLLELPPGVDAPGFTRSREGIVSCDCGEYYTNLQNNPQWPCTPCPDPVLSDGNLVFWVRCDDEGTYPCLSVEEKERGCTRVLVRARLHRGEEETPFSSRVVGL